ncbi:MAG: hypothetical protein H6686_07435 [Fibrobacteria bacterium]|nr:hypothetical protein [Fibrobacteria bacterium]
MNSSPQPIPPTGFRWIWVSTILGAISGIIYGVLHLVFVLVGDGQGIVAARTPVGAAILAGLAAIWFASTISAGALIGLGLSAWRHSSKGASSNHPVAQLASGLQRSLSEIALGALLLAAACWGIWSWIGSALTFGTGAFLALWLPLVAWLSLWTLAACSALPKLAAHLPTSKGEWWEEISTGMLGSIPETLRSLLEHVRSVLVYSGVAWAIFLGAISWQAQRGDSGLLGFAAPGTGWLLALAAFVLVELGLLAYHALTLRAVVVGNIRNRLLDLALTWIPLENLAQIPSAPDLLKKATLPPSGIPWIARFLWRKIGGKLDPIIEGWDKWSASPDPRANLRELLSAEGIDGQTTQWIGLTQIGAAMVWLFLF